MQYAISNDPRELSRPIEGDEQDDVVFTFESGLRIIQMNRPKKLNSLNGSMARKLIGRLKVGSLTMLCKIVPC